MFSAVVLLTLTAGMTPEGTREKSLHRFFEEKVRPVLATHCFECHGPDLDEVKGGLRFSGPEGLARGGVSGPAVVPGRADDSLLLQVVRYEHDLKMPPSGRLGDNEIRWLTRWVEEGAVWPMYGQPERVDGESGHEVHQPSIEEGRAWWSYQPVTRSRPPQLRSDELTARVRNPIDRFVFARLEERGISPNPPADRRTLIRRAYYDLIGLAPTYEEVEAFEDDDSDDAFDKVVDRLLAMPQYGERWGRHWLDLVRFAQTNGYERDREKPFAWRYRDYVIESFNEDRGYDRFVREQLAGDELDEVTPASRVATAFYHLGVWDSEPDDFKQAEYDALDDMLRTTGETFLGLTVGCARCHDHKFDPLPQQDYYGMLAFMRNVLPYEEPVLSEESTVYTPIDPPARIAQWQAQVDRRIGPHQAQVDEIWSEARRRLILSRLARHPPEVKEAFLTPGSERTPEQVSLLRPLAGDLAPRQKHVKSRIPKEQRVRFDKLRAHIDRIRAEEAEKLTWAMSVKEVGPKPKPVHVLHRGDVDQPGDRVFPSFPRVLFGSDAEAVATMPRRTDGDRTSGLRRVLAEWITRDDHPLTSRVMVNRIWQHHFGRGIVPTPNDFGRSGIGPTHPALLDWLASQLVRGEWSIKRMHRLIMGSYVYQMSTSTDRPAQETDQPNDLFWRQNLRRLEAEAIRDSVLQASGRLNLEMGGRGFFPRLSREVLAGSSRPGEGWEISADPTEADRRSVYTFIKRSLLPPMLERFDFASPSLPIGARSITTIAPQSLSLMNSEFMRDHAASLGARVAAAAGPDAEDEQHVDVLYRLALGRIPTATEARIAIDYLDRTRTALSRQTPVFAFAPRVPDTVSEEWIAQASGTDVLAGPVRGWSYAKGTWPKGYSETLTVDPLAGPAALLDDVPVRDGVVETRLLPPEGGAAGVLVRTRAVDDATRGLEIRLDVAAQRASLLHHAEETTTLRNVDATLPPDRWTDVRIALRGDRVVVTLDGDAILDVADPAIESTDGDLVGVRLTGEELRVGPILVDGEVAAAPRPIDPASEALAALALVVLNLNEFVYLD